MKKILVDSSFYVALLFTNDTNHKRAEKLVKEMAKKNNVRQLTSEDFVKETLTIISQRLGRKVAIDFYQRLVTNTQIVPVSSANFQAGLKLFLQEKLNKNVSLIDCTAVSMCSQVNADAMLTFDRHFKTLGVEVLP